MGFEFSSFISVVASLFILEVLLSVDNALVNASLAEDLPLDQRVKAVKQGIIFGAGFRVAALIFASLIIHNVWIKTAGALYLIFLAVNHLGEEITETGKKRPKVVTYKGVVAQIAVANIVFGIDNVVSAVGLSSNIFYVITGVLIGIAAILLISEWMLKVVERFPSLADAAYIIVGIIGALIIAEEIKHTEISSLYKFVVITGIVGLTLLYERDSRLQRALKPSFHKIRIVLGIPADIYQLVKGIFLPKK